MAKSPLRSAAAIASVSGCCVPRRSRWPRREPARLLRSPRRRPRRERAGHQERVPQAGAEAPSRSESRRHSRRRTLQGSGRGLLGARRRRQARALRPLRPRRRRGRGRRPVPGFNPDIFADFSDILGDFFGFGGGGGAAAARRAAPICASISRSRSRSPTPAPRRRFRFRARRRARPARDPGAARRHVARDLSAVPRHRPAPLPAGLPRRRAHVRPVRRHGTDRQDTVRDVPRHGPRRRKIAASPCGFPPGIADGQRLRLHGEGEHGVGGGPTGDLYVVIHVRAARRLPSRRRRPLRRRRRALPDHGDGRIVQGRRPGRSARRRRLGRHGRAARSSAFRGKGMPSVTGRGRGAFYVRLVVDVPRKLTKEQKKLVEELRQDDAGREDRAAHGRRRGRRQAVLREGQRSLRLDAGSFPALDVSWTSRRRTTTRMRPAPRRRSTTTADRGRRHATTASASSFPRPAIASARGIRASAHRRRRRLHAGATSPTRTGRSGVRRRSSPVAGRPSDRAPPWREAEARNRRDQAGAPMLVVIIQPSMGFGTGHHASTRLCLRLLQQQSLDGRARARRRHGLGRAGDRRVDARRGATSSAIDFDPDALQSRAENVERNGADAVVQPRRRGPRRRRPRPRRVRPLRSSCSPISPARCSSGTRRRSAALVAPGGTLIVSGFSGRRSGGRANARSRRAAGATVAGANEDRRAGSRSRLTSPSASTAR